MMTFILGPTASGKSELALALARRRGGAILSLDSMQVYRGADIGTSKPTPSERAEIPHGGLDLAEVGEPFDVARFLAHAADFLRQQAEAGRPVVACGGTGLYFRALTQGLCRAPAAPPAVREALAALSLPELLDRLRQADPEILPTLDARNPRRLARALEVIETTGRSLRAWQAETPPPLVPAFRAYAIARPRAELHRRIEARLDAMLAAGWVEEIRHLAVRHGSEALRRLPALGYRHLADWLQTGGDFAATRQQILADTRAYARRQLTWFRREPKLHWLEMDETTRMESEITAGRLL